MTSSFHYVEIEHAHRFVVVTDTLQGTKDRLSLEHEVPLPATAHFGSAVTSHAAID